jgi:hypothetical protein
MPHWTLGHGADWDIIEEIEKGSDRVALIVGVALVDDRLTEALKKQLDHVSRPISDRWFGDRGTYIDFQKKADIAFMLKFFGPIAFKDLGLLGRARNEAAHSTRTKLFNAATIKGICHDLQLPSHLYNGALIDNPNKKDPKDRFLFTVARLTDYLKLLGEMPDLIVPLP